MLVSCNAATLVRVLRTTSLLAVICKDDELPRFLLQPETQPLPSVMSHILPQLLLHMRSFEFTTRTSVLKECPLPYRSVSLNKSRKTQYLQRGDRCFARSQLQQPQSTQAHARGKISKEPSKTSCSCDLLISLGSLHSGWEREIPATVASEGLESQRALREALHSTLTGFSGPEPGTDEGEAGDVA